MPQVKLISSYLEKRDAVLQVSALIFDLLNPMHEPVLKNLTCYLHLLPLSRFLHAVCDHNRGRKSSRVVRLDHAVSWGVVAVAGASKHRAKPANAYRSRSSSVSSPEAMTTVPACRDDRVSQSRGSSKGDRPSKGEIERSNGSLGTLGSKPGTYSAGSRCPGTSLASCNPMLKNTERA
eukprot:scaffold7_cov378-Prasinococcus_capsulatus_cf.AAC.4